MDAVELPDAAPPPLVLSGDSPIGEGRAFALNAAIRRRIMGRWRFLPGVALGVTVCLGVLGLSWISDMKLGDDAFFGGVVLLIVGMVALLRLCSLQLRRVTLKRWRERGVPASQRLTYRITPGHLVVEGTTTSHAVAWAYVSELAPTKTSWLAPAGGQVFFIPKRFFPDREAEIAFLAAMLEHMPEAARARSPEAVKLTTFA